MGASAARGPAIELAEKVPWDVDKIRLRVLRTPVALTSEQARILLPLVEAHRDEIVVAFSYGIFDGLVVSLDRIDRAGPSIIPPPEDTWTCATCGTKLSRAIRCKEAQQVSVR